MKTGGLTRDEIYDMLDEMPVGTFFMQKRSSQVWLMVKPGRFENKATGDHWMTWRFADHLYTTAGDSWVAS